MVKKSFGKKSDTRDPGFLKRHSAWTPISEWPRPDSAAPAPQNRKNAIKQAGKARISMKIGVVGAVFHGASF